MTKQDYLKRRLQTVLVEKKLATTTKSARQLITHKKVLINSRVVNRPSYIVPIELENKISLKPSKQKAKPKEIKEEVKEENKLEERKVEEKDE